MGNQIETDVIIAGGGVGGLTLAILLANDGVRTCVIENTPPPSLAHVEKSGRTAALFGASVDMIKNCGVWDELSPFCQSMDALEIIDHNTQVLFNAKDIGKQRFGYNVPNMHMRSALYEQAKTTKNISLIAPDSLETFQTTPAAIIATLKSGKTITAPLLVGADGRHSTVREIANIETSHKNYNQTALTFLIKHETAHDDIATEFHKPGGPLALVPMPDNHSAVVWVETNENASNLVKLKKQELLKRLSSITQNKMGDVELISPVKSWDLRLIIAKQLTAPRIALMAEAAHVLPPISAQGLNLSLRDVTKLHELITHNKRLGLDIGSSVMLQNYERARQIDIQTRKFGVDILNTSVRNAAPITSKLRRLGLGQIDFLKPIKTTIMKAGMS